MKKMVLLSAIMLMGVSLNVNAQNESDDSGTLIIPAVYDRVETGADGMFIVTKGQKQGVIDSNGKVVVPVQYDDVKLGHVYENCGGLIVVTNKVERRSDEGRDNVYGLYNKDGVLIAPMDKYDYIRIRDEYGYDGLAEVWILERIENDTLSEFGTNRYTIEKRRVTKEGVILKDGTLLTSYDNMSVKRGGIIVVKKDGKKGVLNKNGEIIIPIKYADVYMREDSKLIEVETPYQDGGRKYGVYNEKGEVVVPIGKYKSLSVKREYIEVKKDGRVGILNQKGVEIIPIGMYEECYIEKCDDNIHSYIGISSNGKRGCANMNGKIIIPLGKYDYYNFMDADIAMVKSNNAFGAVDGNGAIVIPIGKYDKLQMKHGVIVNFKNGKYGIMDKKGNQVLPIEYDNIEAARHSNGMALVAKDGKIGVVDGNGRFVIPCGEYIKGAIVGSVGYLKSEEGTMLFNLDGKILAPTGKYEKCQQKYGQLSGYDLNKWPIPVNPNKSDEGFYVVTSNGKQGVMKLW